MKMSSVFKCLVFIVLLVFGLGERAHATHITGADFSYTCVGQDSFLITFNVFRDCDGISPGTSFALSMENSCGTSISSTLSLQGTQGQEVSQLCTPQLPNSSCNGGTLDGMEVWIYTAIVVIPSSCPGELTATVSGGSGSISYSWPMQLSTATITDLCAGTYPLLVTDGNGCIETDTVELIDSSGLYLDAVVNQVSCAGLCDASITVTPYSGTLPYTYSWEDGTSTATRSNLCPGLYSVTVMDAVGMQYAYFVEIFNVFPVSVSHIVVDEQCAGACDGFVRTNVSGGTPPYSYAWSGGLNGPTNNGVCAGSYALTVTDANGCVGTSTVTVGSSSATVVNTTVNNNASCFGSCDGSATLVPTGGQAPYLFEWPDGSSAATNNVLCAGSHEVTITDASGCAVLDTVVITEPTLINGAGTTTQSACAGTTGSITLTTSGGSGTYTYNWSVLPNPGNVNVVSNLAAGNYSVTITDGSGCSVVENYSIDNATGPTSDGLVVANPTCAGNSDGAASLTPTGGLAPYTYLWSTGATTNAVSGLADGMYGFTITDNNGCKKVGFANIVDPIGLESNLTFSAPSCNGACNGSVTVSPTGGSGGYSIAWSNGGTGLTQTNLCAGTYSVTISDGNSCSVVDSITLINPTPLQDSVLSISNVLCNGDCNGVIELDVYGGVAPYSFTWSNGQSYINAYDLCAGQHLVTITDANGCQIVDTIDVTEPLPITTSISIDNGVECSGLWTMDWQSCCRPGNPNAVNISTASTGMYASATMNQTLPQGDCNSGVEYTTSQSSFPLRYVCLGDSLCYSMGATEPDGDSVVFSFTSAMTNANTNAVYNSPYSAQNPIVGITIDSTAGEVCFLAATLGRFVVTVKATEYDPITGLYLGETFRDILFIVESCPPSSAPFGTTIVNFDSTGGAALADSLRIEMCEGDSFCFDMEFYDSNLVDTGMYVFSNSDLVLPGSNFSYTAVDTVVVNGDSLLHTTATLCWAAAAGSSGNFNFFIKVDDDHCQIPKDFFRTVNVRVTGSTVAWPDRVICGAQTAPMYVAGGSIFGWQSISGDPIIVGQNFTCDSCANPVATPTQTTQYVVTSDLLGLCGNTDTVTVTVAPDFSPMAVPDTILCNVDSVQLDVLIAQPGNYSYQWDNVSSLTDDTLKNPIALPPSTTVYSVTVSSDVGCIKNSNTTINVLPPFPVLAPYATDSALCYGGDTSQLDIAFNNFYSPNCATSIEDCLNSTSYFIEGTGISANTTTSWPAPFGNFRRSAKHQFLIRATELTALGMTAGMISEVGFDVSNINGLASYPNVQMSMGCTADNQLTNSAFITGLTQVLLPTTVTLNVGWNMIPLSSPYLWDGTSNLVIEFCFADLSNAATSNTSTRYTNTTYRSSNLAQSNSTTTSACGATTPNGGAFFRRPNIRFGMCDGPDPLAYSYAWTPNQNMSDSSIINPQVWPTATTTYQVHVNDTFGVCSDSASVTVYIGELDAGNDVKACPGDSVQMNASVFAGCSMGTDTFSWFPTTGVSDTTILNPTIAVSQTTTFYLTYSNACGCVLTDSVTIEVNPMAAPTTIHTPPTCGQFNGSIEVFNVGGFAPYTYSIDSGATFTSVNLFDSLSTDTFDIYVMDSLGCLSPLLKDTLVNPGAPVVDSITVTDPICYGDSNGVIEIHASNGTPPLMYSVDSVNFVNNSNITGLGEGIYTIVVKDDSNCYTWPQYVQLASNSELLLDSVASRDLDCYNDGTGVIELYGTGGTLPYEYSVDSGLTYGSNSIVSNLAGGAYQMVIKDSLGCLSNVIVDTLLQPDSIVINMQLSNDTCFNACGGSAMAMVTGGSSPFTFQWTENGNTIGTNDSVITRLCASGAYNLLVTDSNGCDTTQSFTITQPDMLQVLDSVTHISCNGKTDGEIHLVASGATPPYWFSIDSGATYQSTGSFTGLTAGIYDVLVADSGYRCSEFFRLAITEPSAVFMSTTTSAETLCVTECANIEAIASGGLAPYTYIWSHGLDSNGAQLVCPTENTGYTVYAVDSNGCISNAEVISLVLNDSLRIDAGVDVDICIGDSIQLQANAIGGSGTGYKFLWQPVTGLDNPYVANPIASPMGDMKYTVQVTDDCLTPAATDTVWVRLHEDPQMGFEAVDTTIGCEPFNVTLVNTSTPVEVAEWTIGEDIKALGLSVDITDLYEGVYDVQLRVITAYGCESTITKEDFITVYPLPKPDFVMDPEQTTVYKTIVQMTDLSEGNVQGWEWDFAGYGSSTQQHPLFQFPVDTGSYPVTLTVTSDKMCQDDVVKYLRVGDEYNMYVPNSFTPNGDGQNDVFAPQGIGVDPNQYKLQVYDRWGTLIFESSSLNQPWDGSNQSTGKLVQNGVYVWQIIATDGTDDPQNHQYKGTVTVIR